MIDVNAINDVYSHLEDDESKMIFNTRLNYSFYLNDQIMEEEIFKWNRTFRFNEWNEYISNYTKDEKIVLFGASYGGEFVYKYLVKLGWEKNIVAFADNNAAKHGSTFLGLPIISADELAENYSNAVVIVCVQGWYDEVCAQLKKLGIEKVFVSSSKSFAGIYGNQYFDLPFMTAGKDEVFIDAGCFDGFDCVKFSNWCNGEYKKIYAFEPVEEFKEICEKKFAENNLHDVSFITKGVGDCDQVMKFHRDLSNVYASCIDTSGESQIEITTIDNCLQGERATFIKMDIEGSELSALKGAEKTIKKYKPKLAICIYHKPDDIIVIPKYLLDLDLGYKFYIRHYTNLCAETVLYAI